MSSFYTSSHISTTTADGSNTLSQFCSNRQLPQHNLHRSWRQRVLCTYYYLSHHLYALFFCLVPMLTLPAVSDFHHHSPDCNQHRRLTNRKSYPPANPLRTMHSSRQPTFARREDKLVSVGHHTSKRECVRHLRLCHDEPLGSDPSQWRWYESHCNHRWRCIRCGHSDFKHHRVRHVDSMEKE
jgi:hypothetical protein